MKKSQISVAKVHETKQSVISAVHKAMDMAKWADYVKPSKATKKVFVKVNLLSHQVVPGHCTSPYVLEAVVMKLKQKNFEIFVGDANVATVKQVEKAALNWGMIAVCKKHGTKFVNLSKEPLNKVDFKGKIFKNIKLPKILTEVDYIITLPVPKTHNVSTMTCAMKNQWGCIPSFRQQYHGVVHRAIPEINKILNPDFVVCDATVCSEGEGPRTSTPKACNYVFASNDLVAMDSFIADFMGLDKKKVKYIYWAEKLRIGSSSYQLKGEINEITKKNQVISQDFQKPIQRNHPVVHLEMKLRKVPILSFFLFKTPFFKIPAWLASRYNSIYWYYKIGKKATCKFIKDKPLYAKEFSELMKKQK